jgi:signal transduction histidine kinase
MALVTNLRLARILLRNLEGSSGSLMARIRLRTQLLITTLVIIFALTGAVLLIIRNSIHSEITKQVQASTDASLIAFKSVQQERERDLSRTAAMLAELPTLKALMTTDHAPTIQDASQPFWKLAGSDLFVLANSKGRVLGFQVRKPGWTPELAERDLGKSVGEGESAAWWYADGQLYWVFLCPIVAGAETTQRQLGILAIGYQVDSTVAEQLSLVADSQIALTAGDNVIASTLAPQAVTELQHRITHRETTGSTTTRQIALGSDQYEMASVLIHDGPPTPVECYVLMSLEPANALLERLNRMIVILVLSAVIFAALILTFVSRTITRPLDNLLAGVRALGSGDYAYSITPRGSSEVVELGEAFSKMRGELLESQRRWRANERVAALGRAASSISHDLRHYMAAVVANAEFLYEADKLKMNRDEIYNEIKMASEQMIDLLDSFRELAREEGSITPAPARLDQIIRRAVEAVLARPEFRSRKVKVTTAGSTDGIVDAKKMERAFFNLVLNACEAAPEANGAIRIDICSSDDSFDVRVADNGPGIPAAIRESLFDPFVSLGKLNGTGLGLAIVTKIIHDHRGSVSVEGTSDRGTVFLIKLPRATSSVAEKPRVVAP